MKPTIFFVLTGIMTIFTLVSCNQRQEADLLKPSVFKYFNQEQVLELTLKADWEHLIANKQSESAPPQFGAISWKFADSMKQAPIEISVRGHARRSICGFPPIRLKFSEKSLATLGLNSKYKSLKLVTHCNVGKDDLVLREYLVYRMLNILTDQSFRVQLAKVNYQSPQRTTQAYAFLIENNEELANRLGGTIVEQEPSKLSSIDMEQYNLMSVFQYMIGNTDWHMTKQHNIKLLNKKESTIPTPIPYDFDYSGIVNAEYALPSPRLPIKTVRERFFQWRGTDSAALTQTLDLFREKQAAIYDLVINFEPLPMESRLDMLNYLDAFYKNMPQAPQLVKQ